MAPVVKTEVKSVLIYLCVIRTKVLAAAELKGFRYLWSDDLGYHDLPVIGLQGKIQTQDHRALNHLYEAADRLRIKALNPDEWKEAEIGTEAVSDLVPVRIISTDGSIKLFNNLLALHDRGDGDDSDRFEAFKEEVEAVKEAVLYRKEGNSFADMQNEMLTSLLGVIASIPRMLFL